MNGGISTEGRALCELRQRPKELRSPGFLIHEGDQGLPRRCQSREVH